MSALYDLVAAAVADKAPKTAPDAGIAVAVIKDGEVALAEGFGLRDLMQKTPVDAQTVFAVGSTTKAFTSFVALRLAEDGVVDLDVPVRTYLPDFAIEDPEASAQMTLADLLSHQSGVPRHDLLWYLGPFSRGQLFYRARHLGPGASGSGFRQQLQYNNIMYSIAATALEAASGRSWSELVKTLVLDPLGLSATLSIADLQAAPNHATPYAGIVPLAYDDLENIAPAGAINANVLDMAQWMLLLLNKGMAPDGASLIPPQQIDNMFQSRIAAPLGEGYGLGWYVGSRQGKRLLHHPGDAQGYTAYASLMPDDGIAVVALTNQNFSNFPGAVADAIYSALLNDPSLETARQGAGLLDLHHPGPPATQLAAAAAPASLEYNGLYSDPGYGDIVVSNVGGRLQLSYYNTTWPLQNIAGDQFVFNLDVFGLHFQPKVPFNRDTSGAVDALSIRFEPTAAPIRFKRR